MSSGTGLPFVKMQGAGNDYVYLDGFSEDLPDNLPALAQAMADRHYGIGGDGLICLLPSDRSDSAVRMRMFNADGSESEMCGNGLRCLSRLAVTKGHTGGALVFTVETGAGPLPVQVATAEDDGVTIQLGQPRLSPETVPVNHNGSGPRLDVGIALPAGMGPHTFHAVGMGNPHAVCFVDDCDAVPLEIVGPFVEHNDRFPNRTNVEFVTIESPTRIRQRTWERGSGETLACGTGAAATAVAAMLTERIPGPQVTIALRGGDLTVTWDGQLDSPVFQHGAATTVFAGSWPLT